MLKKTPVRNEALVTKPENSTTQTIAKLPLKVSRPFLMGIVLTAAIGGVAMLLSPLPGLAALGSLTIAMLLGIIWRAFIGLPKGYTGGVQFSARRLLRYGIILTGVRLNFGLIASSGLQVLILDTVLIALGISLIPLIGRKLGLKPGLALMVATGQSICGASAVGAVLPLTRDGDQDDVSLAVALCGVLGTLGVLFFVICNQFFGLQDRFYALLSGSTLHEIAQVVAAGPVAGAASADLAMVVKLTRVMLLAPVVIILALIISFRAQRQAETDQKGAFDWKKLPLPWFILGFLAVGVINSLGWLPKDVANGVLQISIFLMVTAMAAMGLMVDLAVIRRTGLKALAVASLAFVGFVAVSAALITVFGMA